MNIQWGYIEWYKSLSMVPYDLRVANNTFTFTLSKKFSKKKKKKKKKKRKKERKTFDMYETRV